MSNEGIIDNTKHQNNHNNQYKSKLTIEVYDIMRGVRTYAAHYDRCTYLCRTDG